MCLNITRVRRTFRYNWAGDQIASPLVSAARRVPGSKRVSLDIDIREFLAIDHSAEIRHFFFHDIVDSQPANERERFFVGKPGNFDFRMHCVIEAFGKLKYLPVEGRGREEWLLPAETLANGGGDCEDLAFLLMALLEETGISRSCLRLALGQLIETGPDFHQRCHDHVWVMYQLEGGAWIVLDPVERVEQYSRGKPIKPQERVVESCYEYCPLFVMNRDHLWRVHGPNGDKHTHELDKYLKRGRRSFWSHYDPAFAAGVHSSIFDQQMKELSWVDRFVVKNASLALDVNVLSYDPRDHCDFAYIDSSWKRINDRLQTGHLNDLGYACHTVADFYAHTLYGHVVPAVGGELPLYQPQIPVDPGTKQDEVFNRVRFDINNDKPTLTEEQTSAYWKGRLISGQWWRWYTTYPDDIQNSKELNPRRCLPDHDLLAVDDSADADNPKHLYPTKKLYNAQFALRKNAAERHVRELFLKWYKQFR